MTTDWVTHAYGMARGGSVVHVIHSTLTAFQMARALRKKGIDTWAWATDREGSISFRVGRRQERFARSTLEKAGAILV